MTNDLSEFPQRVTSDIMTYSDLVLRPDPSRTVIRPFTPSDAEGYVDRDRPRAQPESPLLRITDQTADGLLSAGIRTWAGASANVRYGSVPAGPFWTKSGGKPTVCFRA
jgi:hypothetical protein